MCTDGMQELKARVDKTVLNKWRSLLDQLVDLTAAPKILILQMNSGIADIVISLGSDQSITLGEKHQADLGLLISHIVESKEFVFCDDVPQNAQWKDSPLYSLGIKAFMGCPIRWPNGEAFGSLCVLDIKARPFTEQVKALLLQISGLFQDDLARIYIENDRDRLTKDNETLKKSLLEAKAHYDNTFKSSPVGLVISSMSTGKIVDVNQAFQDIFGYTKDESIGKSALELDLYWDLSERDRIVQKLKNGELIRSYEMSMRTKSGERKIVQASLESTVWAGQNYLITQVFDINTLRHIQLEAQLLSERYLLATRAAQAGIWDWDIVNNVLIWDDQMYRIYDATREEFGGAYEAWLARIHPEDMEKADHESRMAVLGQKEYATEFRILTSMGTIRFIKAYGDVICDPQGNPLRMVGVNFDITAQKQLESDLSVSEQKYKDLFNQNSAVRIVVDVETGNLFDVNPAACSFYGYSRDQLLSMNATSINGMPIERVLKILESAYYRKRDHFQTKHQLASGEFRDVEIFSGPIDINHRKYVNCIVQDVTERKKTEQKLIASEARYREIFHNNSAAQILVNPETLVIEDANPAALGFYGYSLEEIKMKTLWELNASGESSISSKLGQTFSKGSNHFITQHKLADQTIRDVEVFNGIIQVEERRLIHAIIYDITESSKAILDLVESERRFRQLIENAPDGIIVETDGFFAYVNQKAAKLIHADKQDDLIGSSLVDFFMPNDREYIRLLIQDLHEGVKIRMFSEETIMRLDGELVDVELSAVPFRYNEKDGALIYLHDMSERREFERNKAEMESQLRQKQKLESIGTLAGGVAHEINNPINGIINYAELIADGNLSSEQMKEFSQGIIFEGKRIADIVKNLLSFARQEKQSHSPAQISDIINQTVSLMRVMLRHDQIALELDIPEGLPSIKCRSNQIQQVIMNLITNARDALNVKYVGYHEKKLIKIDCRMFQKDGRRWFRITVLDFGTGIPAEIMERIFDPFFTTKPRDEGTGLGLSISHGIVKDHHGELYFETEPGKFTRAILILPVDNGWSIQEDQ